MGQAQRGQPTLASPPGALGPRHRWGQSVNSQARLWVLGALVHPWLLSRQDFPGIRCCLGNPGGRRHVSPTRKCLRSVLTPSPTAAACGRVCLREWGAGVPQQRRAWPRAQSPGLAKMPLSLLLPPPSVLVHMVGMWLAGVGRGSSHQPGALALLPLAPLSPGGPRRPGRPASP